MLGGKRARKRSGGRRTSSACTGLDLKCTVSRMLLWLRARLSIPQIQKMHPDYLCMKHSLVVPSYRTDTIISTAPFACPAHSDVRGSAQPPEWQHALTNAERQELWISALGQLQCWCMPLGAPLFRVREGRRAARRCTRHGSSMVLLTWLLRARYLAGAYLFARWWSTIRRMSSSLAPLTARPRAFNSSLS